uniref:CSON014287 protein n=1 Tax=Culicoides sonorensis TaxID=179676 RepID=A0A336MAD0_CULSO
MFFLIEITTFIVILIISLWIFVKSKYNYWKDRQIPYIEPIFPTGTIHLKDKPLNNAFINQLYYNKMKGKGPFCGIFFYIQPAVLALELEFIKKVLIKDFKHFHDRGMYYNEKTDPITGHLFNLEGEKWKMLRSKISPSFSAGKIKQMFPSIVTIGDELVKALNVTLQSDPEIEMKDFIARYGTDVIGTCAFGLNCNSLADPDAPFREMGRRIFGKPRNPRYLQIFLITFKEFGKLLGMKTLRDDVSQFVLDTIKETVEYRNLNQVERHDFMELLIKLKNNGEITLNELAAQCYVFYIGGFETSSTTISYALFELAQNEELQNKVRAHINEIMARHNGILSYECLSDMTYVEQCIQESLRKYPPVPHLIREVTQDYPVEHYNCVLKKGTLLHVPVYAIQHDPEYYPNPEEFNPDRFNSDETLKRDPITFIPFGEGPRICPGVRFGMIQSKLALALLLKNFQFKLSPKMKLPLTYVPGSVILTTEGGLWLNLTSIKSQS